MKYREEYLILIADNDRDLSLKMSRSLMDAGYKTVMANDGIQAQVLFNELMPHLLVLDIGISGIDPQDILKQTRFRGYTVPVIVTASNPNIAAALQAIQTGAFDYIVKPFKLELLQQKISNALQSIKAARENTPSHRAHFSA